MKSDNVVYERENDEEYRKRLKYELTESKLKIEKKLQKKVDHLCWPFGGRNESTIKLAEDLGYVTSTARSGKNIFNKKFKRRIDRISLDNPKYQNSLFYLYGLYKILSYKL